MDPIFGAIQQNLDSALSVPFVSSSVVLGLAFYAYKAAPELPSFMEELFLNVFFQIFVGFMVLYMSTQNFMLSLVVSVVFVYGVGMISGLKEGMFGGMRGCGWNTGHTIERLFPGKEVDYMKIPQWIKNGYTYEELQSCIMDSLDKKIVNLPWYIPN